MTRNMRFSNLRPIWLLLFFYLCLASAVVYGQIDQGTVTGIVRDPQDKVIVGATVTLTNNDTNLTLTRQTGDTGDYTFAPLKIGNYTIKVSATGFATAVRENVRLDVSQIVRLDFVLRPGTIHETMTVTTQAEVLQTQEASTGQVFSAQVINDMPLNNNNYVFAAQLTTGVAAPNQGFTQVAGAGDFTSNGNRVSQNNFVLDGVDNNSNMQDFLNGATYAVRPPPDALQEFKVESSNYSAELGRSTGAAINATIKSGTNRFHGKLWEYLENDRMNAIDYDFGQKVHRTAFHQNQFGLDVGGPIWKDKLFFFVDAQGTRISGYQPPGQNNTVPTAQERTGDFTEMLDPNNTTGFGSIALYQVGGNVTDAPGLPDDPAYPPNYLTCNGVQNVVCNPNPIAERILNLFPQPNTGAPHQVFLNYTIPASAATNNTAQFDARFDYNFSTKDQMFFRFSYSNNPRSYMPPFGVLDGGGFGTDGHDTNLAKSGALSETHFFTPNLVNEFRLGYNWLRASYLQPGSGTDIAAQVGMGGIPSGPDLGGFPSIYFGSPDSINGIGVPSYEPSDERQNVAQIIDNLTKVVGRHALKTGINFHHVRFYGLQPPDGIGFQGFDGSHTYDPGQPTVYTGSGVADFLLDLMAWSGLNTVTPYTNLRWYYSTFVQDDWKVTPRLTLNLGLRWEYTEPFRELNDHQSNFYATSYAPMNQGTGVYLIPASQRNFPIAPTLVSTLAADNIAIQYTGNDYLVNPNKANFAPRIGASYSLNQKTVVRAGFGLFYGGFENIGLGLNLANNAPFFVSAEFVPNPWICQNVLGVVTCPTNGETLETGFGAAANNPTALANASGIGAIYANDQNAKTARTAQYNLSVQRMLTNTMTFTASYEGNQSKHLRSSYASNTYPGFVPTGQPGQNYQPFHDFYIVNVTAEGIGRYDSLQAKIDKRYSNGLYFLGGYTWAHCLDDAFGPIGQRDYGGYRNPTFLGFRYDYGTCTQNVGQRLTLNAQYDLPFGKGRRFAGNAGIADYVIGGWKASLVFQAQTGNPVFFTSTNQGGSYPFRVGDPFAAGGTQNPATQPGFGGIACPTKVHTIQQWYNPCAFYNPPQATLGATDPSHNLININQAGLLPAGPRGRVSIPGPGFNKVDMSLFKNFALGHSESAPVLQLRADSFNVLNHPSFGDPGTSLSGGAGYQALTYTRFSGLIPDARVIQVGARLSF
jgi:hypothetical protein